LGQQEGRARGQRKTRPAATRWGSCSHARIDEDGVDPACAK
jgi:hypothetical protein